MATIDIGDVREIFQPDDDTMLAYVSVDVTVDGVTIRVGTMVGVPEWQHDTARAARSGVRPFLATWYPDASDHQDVPEEHEDAVREVLDAAKGRLWRQVVAMRAAQAKPVRHEVVAVTEIPPDMLRAPDLRAEVTPESKAYRLTVARSAETCEVLICGDRAGVVWGGDATWVDVHDGEDAETIADIVMNDAEETNHRR